MATYLYPPVSVTTLPPLGGATSANQVLEIAQLTAINGKVSTEAKQDDQITLSTALNAKDFATQAKQDAQIAQIVTLLAKDFATQTTLAALLAELMLKADLSETQPVSIVGTVPVSGGLTDAELRATPVPVSGTVTANAGTNLNTSALNLEATQLLIKAKTDNLDVALSTIAKDATLLASNVLIGAVTETAPATDTASSGLNGRLQRIAQRLTSMIALLPAALGQGTMAQGLRVVLPSDQSAIPTNSTQQSVAGTITSGQIAVGTSAVRATVAGTAPNAARKKLMVKPNTANGGKIFIGASGVTTANGMEIIGPDRLEFEFDAGDYYLISDTAAQVVEIVEKV